LRHIICEERERDRVSSSEPSRGSGAHAPVVGQLAVETRTQRRTVLVALRGELDVVTVSKVAEVLDGLEPEADGVRHVVLDLRGLTFMDVVGLRELLRQNEYARANRHNLAVVRGTEAIQRVLELTDVEGQLVIVDDPDDLVPPRSPTDGAAPRPDAASFEIALTRAAGRVTLTLVGELDLATTPRLEKYLTTIAATQQELIVIDLRQLTFLDSTGVAALVAADRHARRDGRSLAIVKGPPQVQRVLDICGLTEVLALADEPLEAGGGEA
jgi:anti-sigma B factor antagonist